MAIDHLMDAIGQSREDFSCRDLLHRSHQRFSPPIRLFAALGIRSGTNSSFLEPGHRGSTGFKRF
jgi:hypothetical protein